MRLFQGVKQFIPSQITKLSSSPVVHKMCSCQRAIKFSNTFEGLVNCTISGVENSFRAGNVVAIEELEFEGELRRQVLKETVGLESRLKVPSRADGNAQVTPSEVGHVVAFGAHFPPPFDRRFVQFGRALPLVLDQFQLKPLRRRHFRLDLDQFSEQELHTWTKLW